MIQAKRVYDPPAKGDGHRFLVDRLWPRGMKKESLRSVTWLKEIAPSEELRRWFNHDAGKWREFQKRYIAELDAAPETWEPLLAAAREGTVTLLYGARDIEHNNAIVLKSYLEKHLASSRVRA